MPRWAIRCPHVRTPGDRDEPAPPAPFWPVRPTEPVAHRHSVWRKRDSTRRWVKGDEEFGLQGVEGNVVGSASSTGRIAHGCLLAVVVLGSLAGDIAVPARGDA